MIGTNFKFHTYCLKKKKKLSLEAHVKQLLFWHRHCSFKDVKVLCYIIEIEEHFIFYRSLYDYIRSKLFSKSPSSLRSSG